MKAAFDTVNREILAKSLEKRGVSKRLRERILEIYEETRSVARVEEKVGRRFWIGKEVRQGCPLSLMLFNLIKADIKEGLGNDGMGGKDRGKKIENIGICG